MVFLGNSQPSGSGNRGGTRDQKILAGRSKLYALTDNEWSCRRPELQDQNSNEKSLWF